MQPSCPLEASYQRRLTPLRKYLKRRTTSTVYTRLLACHNEKHILSPELPPFSHPPSLLPQQLLHEYWDSGTYPRWFQNGNFNTRFGNFSDVLDMTSTHVCLPHEWTVLSDIYRKYSATVIHIHRFITLSNHQFVNNIRPIETHYYATTLICFHIMMQCPSFSFTWRLPTSAYRMNGEC